MNGDYMRSLLDSVSAQIKTANSLKDINLFSILGMENKEVSAHSAFLYYIFKPFRDENGKLDDINLRILYHYLLGADSEPQFLDIQREVPFDNGRLDFLLVFDSDAAVIELKVWAGEQPYQIERYRKYLRQNGYTEDNVFFLTPYGKDAMTGDAKPISLKKDMKDVLEEVKEERKTHRQYTAIVQQYLSLVDKLTGDNTMNANEVIRTKKDIEACDKLNELKQAALTQILELFLNELQGALVENRKLSVASYEGKTFKLIDPDTTDSDKFKYQNAKNYYKRGTSCYPAIIFTLDKEGFKYENYLKNDQELYFYIEINDKLYCGITTRTNITSPVNLSELYKSISSGKTKTTKKGLHLFDGVWWSWEYVSYNGRSIDFCNYAKEEGVFSILKDDTLAFIDGSIETIAKGILESFKNQYNYFFTPGI